MVVKTHTSTAMPGLNGGGGVGGGVSPLSASYVRNNRRRVRRRVSIVVLSLVGFKGEVEF